MPRHATATTERPTIPEAELAARYAVNPTYERAALLLKHHPDVPVDPATAALVPVYAEWRAAAGRVLAANPAARYRTTDKTTRGRGQEVMRPIAAPPSEAETEALRTAIAVSVARWREVQATDAAVDTAALHDGFRVAAWSGDWSALIGAWRAWMAAIVTAHNVGGERAALRVTLCIRPGPLPAFRRWDVGEVLPPPLFTDELDLALRTVPPVLTGKGR